MKKIYILCFLLFGIEIMSCAMHNQKNTEVSFYVVINTISDDVLKNDLSGVVLDKSPVFTTKDIIEYSQSEHAVKLSKEAYKKYRAIRKGTAFAFFVDNKPVYLGVVWGSYFNAPQGCVVTLECKGNCVQIM